MVRGQAMAEQTGAKVELEPGVLINKRYELIRQLAAGGMGSVWVAGDRSLDTPCALKFLDDALLSSNEVRARFLREAKAAAQIRSQHVVQVFEYGVWNDRPFIAMEYLEGEDLAQHLERYGLLDAETTYRIVAHVARALHRAHGVGIVHRDLKPENIYLVEGDEGVVAKVLDFGIAQHAAYSAIDKTTKRGRCLGTPTYMSPEQARGDPTDHRSDLWSLGVIAFQCLTGWLPFSADALGTLFGQILHDPIPAPSERAPHLPAAVDEWWRKAAQREREERFQSAAELSDALAAALGLERIVVGGTQASGSGRPRAKLSPQPPARASLPLGSELSTPAIAQRPSRLSRARSGEARVSARRFGDTQPSLRRQMERGLLYRLGGPAASRLLTRLRSIRHAAAWSRARSSDACAALLERLQRGWLGRLGGPAASRLVARPRSSRVSDAALSRTRSASPPRRRLWLGRSWLGIGAAVVLLIIAVGMGVNREPSAAPAGAASANLGSARVVPPAPATPTSPAAPRPAKPRYSAADLSAEELFDSGAAEAATPQTAGGESAERGAREERGPAKVRKGTTARPRPRPVKPRTRTANEEFDYGI
jgi:serine/threonine protein kinase